MHHAYGAYKHILTESGERWAGFGILPNACGKLKVEQST